MLELLNWLRASCFAPSVPLFPVQRLQWLHRHSGIETSGAKTSRSMSNPFSCESRPQPIHADRDRSRGAGHASSRRGSPQEGRPLAPRRHRQGAGPVEEPVRVYSWCDLRFRSVRDGLWGQRRRSSHERLYWNRTFCLSSQNVCASAGGDCSGILGKNAQTGVGRRKYGHLPMTAIGMDS